MKLAKGRTETRQGKTAVEVLNMAAENRGPLVHALIGMLPALNRHIVRTFNPDRKDTHWGSASSGEKPMTTVKAAAQAWFEMSRKAWPLCMPPQEPNKFFERSGG
jgi:hypothetical protein